jgi:threonyl-tRNA synthetase
MMVIGDKELESNSVAVRSRKVGDLGTIAAQAFVDKIIEEIRTKAK